MKVWNKNTYYSTTLPLSRKNPDFPSFYADFFPVFLAFSSISRYKEKWDIVYFVKNRKNQTGLFQFGNE